MKKNSKKRLTYLIGFILLLILVVPIRTKYRGGGTVEYKAILYKIIDWKELPNNGLEKTSTDIYFFPNNFHDIDYYKIDSNDYVDLYKQLIEEIYKTSPELNRDAKYLAIDLNSFANISASDKDVLLNYVKKYNNTIINGNYGVLEKDENGDLYGILISIDNFKEYNMTVSLEIKKYRSSLGSVGNVYKCTYKNNNWLIKNVGMSIS